VQRDPHAQQRNTAMVSDLTATRERIGGALAGGGHLIVLRQQNTRS
jgi:hypothetical protein